MKILVVADTHGYTSPLEKILKKHASDVALVCHLGNHPDDLLRFQGEYPQLNMVAIEGNGDYSDAEDEIVLSFSPCLDSAAAVVRILLIHGHRNGVSLGLDRLAYYAREKGVNACFFGHTHFPEMNNVGGIFMLNPGSPSSPRGGSKPSYAIAEISPEGGIHGKFFEI